jgi:hypothetical protein
MKHPAGKLETRREFLRAGGRYIALGGLACLVTVQEVKRRRLVGDPNCIRIATCRDCIEFQGCNKSRAEEFRSGSVDSPGGTIPTNG